MAAFVAIAVALKKRKGASEVPIEGILEPWRGDLRALSRACKTGHASLATMILLERSMSQGRWVCRTRTKKSQPPVRGVSMSDKITPDSKPIFIILTPVIAKGRRHVIVA
jgi:hypothetical protein